MPLVDVAFAAGFGSLRQFNDTMRQELGVAPGTFRDGAAARPGPDGQGAAGTTAASSRDGLGEGAGGPGGWLTLRLAHREPFAAAPLIAFLAARAIPAVESATGGTYVRALRTPGGSAVASLTPGDGHLLLRVRLDDMAEVGSVVRRCRRLLDLDSDPDAIARGLQRDPLLGRLVAARPGLRVPGSAEPFETAVRAVLGQQVSVGAARTLAARLVVRLRRASGRSGRSHHPPLPHARPARRGRSRRAGPHRAPDRVDPGAQPGGGDRRGRPRRR